MDPGDLVVEIYKEFLDPRDMHWHLTHRQQREYLQYLPCLLCERACAGTCGKFPSSS
jgi:hypothetical protein